MTSAIAPVVSLADGRAVTTSQEVARVFARPHKDVLEAIRSLIAETPPPFAGRNFPPSDYTDRSGRKLPAYTLTRDGFTLLAMGFTGKRALDFKLAYIDAFNRLEAAVHGLTVTTPAEIPLARPSVRTQVVMSGELHRKLKVKAITQGASVKDLIIAAAEDAVRDFDLVAALRQHSPESLS